MSAHTPGPWINDEGVVFGRDSRARYPNHPSIDIFDATEWPAELEAEALANAKLIAAGLDMLAALRSAWAALKACQHDVASPRLAEDAAAWCERAITAATGSFASC